jgi:hypothetical protein
MYIPVFSLPSNSTQSCLQVDADQIAVGVFWLTMRCLYLTLCLQAKKCAFEYEKKNFTFLWGICSTIHLASFLLPIAAYNNRITWLQVCKLT